MLLLTALALSAPQPCDSLPAGMQIARYTYYNPGSLERNVYVISTPGLVIESMETNDDIIGGVSMSEFRTTYNRTKEEVSRIMVFNSSILHTDDTTFEEETAKCAVQSFFKTDTIYRISLLCNDSLLVHYALSTDIPNIHPSGLLYPEIKTLPLRIERGSTTTSFQEFITDSAEQVKILNKLNLDVESFSYVDMEDIRNYVSSAFGMTLEEYGAFIKKKAAELKKEKRP